MQHETKAFESTRKIAWRKPINMPETRQPSIHPDEAERRRRLFNKAIKAQGTTMSALSERLGVSRTVGSRWARGVQAVPDKYVKTIELLGGGQ